MLITSDGMQVQEDLRDHNNRIHQHQDTQHNLEGSAVEEFNRSPPASGSATEGFNMERWIKYYGMQLGKQNLFMISILLKNNACWYINIAHGASQCVGNSIGIDLLLHNVYKTRDRYKSVPGLHNNKCKWEERWHSVVVPVQLGFTLWFCSPDPRDELRDPISHPAPKRQITP